MTVVRVVITGRRGDVGYLISVLDLVWGESGEAEVVRLPVKQVHASLFSTMFLYCANASPEQAL